MGMYEEPRNVIRKLGIDFVEMERNREQALCCGAEWRAEESVPRNFL